MPGVEVVRVLLIANPDLYAIKSRQLERAAGFSV